MLYTKLRFRMYSQECGSLVDGQGIPLSGKMPKDIVFDAATDPLSQTAMLTTVKKSHEYYRGALFRQLIWCALYLLVVIISVVLWKMVTPHLALLVVLSSFLLGDKVFNLPDNSLEDCEGNRLHLSTGYLVTADGTNIVLYDS